jgi:hypothetical protein
MASYRPKHVATPHSVTKILLELCLTEFCRYYQCYNDTTGWTTLIVHFNFVTCYYLNSVAVYYAIAPTPSAYVARPCVTSPRRCVNTWHSLALQQPHALIPPTRLILFQRLYYVSHEALYCTVHCYVNQTGSRKVRVHLVYISTFLF